jgi:hypothetical protein
MRTVAGKVPIAHIVQMVNVPEAQEVQSLAVGIAGHSSELAVGGRTHRATIGTIRRNFHVQLRMFYTGR